MDNMVLPDQGAHTIMRLCSHAAAIASALLANICHLIYSKSTSKLLFHQYKFSILCGLVILFISFQLIKNSIISWKFFIG
ncbi:MAG: hypothetical protein WCG25_00435 [bacterium]